MNKKPPHFFKSITSLSTFSRVVIFCTVCLLLIVYEKNKNDFRKDEGYRFINLSNNQYYLIKNNLDKSLVDLDLLGSVIESQPNLTRNEFKNYATRIISHTPEIQALEWIPKVTKFNRQKIENEGKKYFSNFNITQKKDKGMLPDIQRSVYYPVYYVEPYVGNECALGFNLDSDPKRSFALHLAEKNKTIIATESIKLVQETDGQRGVLIFNPIFTHEKTASRTQEDQLIGFSLVVLRMGDLVNRALSKNSSTPIFLTIYDVSNPSEKEVLFKSSNTALSHHNVSDLNNHSVYKIEKTMELGNRKWLFTFTAVSGTLLESQQYAFYLIYILMILFGFLLVFYIEKKNKINLFLQKSEFELKLALDSGQMGTWKIDLDTKIRTYDDTTLKLLGLDKNTFKGTEAEVLSIVHPEDKSNLIKVIKQSKDFKTKFFIEYRILGKDNSIHHISSHGKVLENDKGKAIAIYGVLWNDDFRKNAEEKIKNMALTDSLTGLPNRRMLNERLKRCIAINTRLNCYSTLMFIDLDRFKDTNDILGHDAGDELLIKVSNRLKSSVRSVDTIARIGGDEFIILIENVGKTIIDSTNNTKIIAEHIKSSFNEVFIIDGKEIFSTCSIGITVFSKDKTNTEEIIKEADFAMYESKSLGRNEFRFYDVSMQNAVKKISEFELDLQNAISKNKFNIIIQPAVDTLNNSIYLFEIGLIWQRQPTVHLYLKDFYDTAVQTGSIYEIQKWLLKETFTLLSNNLRDDKNKPHLYAIMISSRSLLHPKFLEYLDELSLNHVIDKSKLAFLISNDELHEKFEDLSRVINILNNEGFKIILDNFGQGLISVKLINDLPLLAIKMADNFINYINEMEQTNKTIIPLIIQLAHLISTNIIVSNVNTSNEADTLKSYHCNIIQGDYTTLLRK
ncbi:MAG: hypothetical protein B7Z65_08460 [Ferrovum sp. 21-44-67]|jgi:diguanylate cyclase (GGDEF)-like protein|nr:MAG: hypothetical protein B7Z65_08460 [Ferrovum sp. 21-44-67]HQT82154.1 diguanylate cyclase [Ferrovaceae bacterium]HQU07268.1 diguanylate cyclase [Ferrovaceae bacterium]